MMKSNFIVRKSSGCSRAQCRHGGALLHRSRKFNSWQKKPAAYFRLALGNRFRREARRIHATGSVRFMETAKILSPEKPFLCLPSGGMFAGWKAAQ